MWPRSPSMHSLPVLQSASSCNAYWSILVLVPPPRVNGVERSLYDAKWKMLITSDGWHRRGKACARTSPVSPTTHTHTPLAFIATPASRCHANRPTDGRPPTHPPTTQSRRPRCYFCTRNLVQLAADHSTTLPAARGDLISFRSGSASCTRHASERGV